MRISALHGLALAVGLLGACTDDGPRFMFSVRLELTPDVTSVTVDGIPRVVQKSPGVQYVAVDRSFVDYRAGESAAPIALETYAGSTLLHQGMSAVGNCERDCRTWGSPDCPTPDTITKELVGPPPGKDFGARDYVVLECGDAMYTIDGPPIP